MDEFLESRPIRGRADPTIAVVVPAYNSEAFIARTLAGVAAQTRLPNEVIVVDDGSKDRTSEAVQAAAQAFPVPLRLLQQANAGPGAARNAGIAAACAEWISFLDADDAWTPNKLAHVLQALREGPEVDLLCHDEWHVAPDGTERQVAYAIPTDRMYERLLLGGNAISTSAAVVRRDLVLRVGGFSADRSLDSAEDYDLWLRLARAGARFRFLGLPLGRYAIHPEGISQRVDRHAAAVLRVVTRHGVESGLAARRPLAWRRRLALLSLGSGLAHHRGGAYGAALRMYARSVRCYPLQWKPYAAALAAAVRMPV